MTAVFYLARSLKRQPGVRATTEVMSSELVLENLGDLATAGKNSINKTETETKQVLWNVVFL